MQSNVLVLTKAMAERYVEYNLYVLRIRNVTK